MLEHTNFGNFPMTKHAVFGNFPIRSGNKKPAEAGLPIRIRLLLFLVKRLLLAVRAVLQKLHLRGMSLFVAGGVVVFVAALGAFENRLITFFRRHGFTSFTA